MVNGHLYAVALGAPLNGGLTKLAMALIVAFHPPHNQTLSLDHPRLGQVGHHWRYQHLVRYLVIVCRKQPIPRNLYSRCRTLCCHNRYV